MSILDDLRTDIGDDDVTVVASGSSQSVGVNQSRTISELSVNINNDDVSVVSSGVTQVANVLGSPLVNHLRTDLDDDDVIVSSSGVVQLAGNLGSPLTDHLRVDISDDLGIPSDVRFVFAPASSTDNAIVRWDGTSGRFIQDSNVIVDDSGNLTTIGDLTGNHIFPIRIITGPGNVSVSDSENGVFLNKTIGAPTTVTLPLAPPAGHLVIVKDKKGDAQTNNVTVDTLVGVIDGFANVLLTQNYQSYIFMFDGTDWTII